MKKVSHEEARAEYRRSDFGKGVRGKYLEAYRSGTNLVLLRPEVAAVFPNEESVHEALASLIKVAQDSVQVKKKRPSHAKSGRGILSQ